jgi:hypothetical protein
MPKWTAPRESQTEVLTDDTACLRNTGTPPELYSGLRRGMGGGGGGGVGGILAAVLSWFSPLAQLKPRPEDREPYHEPDHHNVI